VIAMQGFNKVILAGNITRDPQLKYLPNNTAVCEFGLAMNRRWRDKDGNQHEDVCFVDVSAFARQAETINQYMSKGKSILIEGRLKLDQWTSQDGQKRSRLSVVAENFTFLGGPRDGGPQGGGGDYSGAPATRNNYERGNAGGGASGYGNPGRGPAAGPQRSGAPAAAGPAAAADESYSEAPMSDDRPPTNDDIPF
jgi:single-strand DNA-binding protein